MPAETWFDQRNQIYCWPDREVDPAEYISAGVLRIDMVHLPPEVQPYHDARYQLIINRAKKLAGSGVFVLIPAFVHSHHELIAGEIIVVGGILETVCVIDHAKYLLEQGAAKKVIIDQALTANH